jgi:hypothetical protein
MVSEEHTTAIFRAGNTGGMFPLNVGIRCNTRRYLIGKNLFKIKSVGNTLDMVV